MDDQAEVLVLDDESIVCERLKEHLEKEGFRVETFTDSESALARLAAKRFDVVVTDLKMKGPGGLDVMHTVRDSARGTQVILITCYASMEAAREAEYGGVFEFVLKPFQLDHLTKLVRKAAKKAHSLGRP
jgi:DNA-binding NtrC family response regulator